LSPNHSIFQSVNAVFYDIEAIREGWIIKDYSSYKVKLGKDRFKLVGLVYI